MTPANRPRTCSECDHYRELTCRKFNETTKPQTRACALGVKTVPADRQGALL